MHGGVDGLLRDKTRPSRIPPLGARGGRARGGADADRSAGGDDPLDRRQDGEDGRHQRQLGAAHLARPWPAAAPGPAVQALERSASSSTSCSDVVGLYVDPPAHAIVLSVDEKSQIQALDRTQPGLPMKKGRAGTMTHDYKRHGTTTLFAALNVLDGTVIGRNMQRHRHQEFIRFLNAIEADGPGRQARPRHPRQLRRPQAPEGARLARPPSALHLPLHADLVLLAQRRRRLLRQAHQAPAEARRLPLHRRSSGRHQPLRRASTTLKPKPFVWTADPDKIIAAVRRGHQVLDSIH